jgi:[CysO sulfur-carrier protein]-S-L-cysteine hydrolase
VLELTGAQRDAIVAACVRALPDEGCGLLIGGAGGRVDAVVASPNVAASARLYEVDSRVLLRAHRDAEARGLQVMGVFHSHTHSAAEPSPTDVAQAPDPSWHYVLVSLRDPEAVLRSFTIADGAVTEEPVSVVA